MKTIFRAVALVAVSLLGFAQSPSVTVADTVKIAISGQNAVGAMSLSWPSFTTSDGTYVAGGTQSIRLTNGAFSVAVFPTAGATPTTGGPIPVYYNVHYTLTSGATLSENWSVPISGGTLKISNVLVPVPPTLQGPSGSTLPQHCNTGQFFMVSGVQNVCVSPDTWAALETGAQAASLFVAAPGGNGIPFVSGPTSSRLATANDLTGLLGYTPTNPANALSEYSASAAAARTSLGLGTSATHPATDFLNTNILGAPNGAAQLDGNGKVPAGQIPALTGLGSINLSQITITGTPAANKFLNSQNGWAQVDYSQVANAPTVPTDDNQIANSAGYAKSADLSAVATSGRYSDLLGLPTYGDVVTHSASEFVPASSKDQPNGVPGLGSGGKISASELPQIDATTGVTGLGTAAFQNSNAFLSASLLGAHSGVAQLDTNGKLLAAQLPAIDYSVLTNTPSIPTKLSQLTNDANFLTLANLSPVAVSGSYTDLSNKPSLNFDPAGTAASLVVGLLKASNNLSDVVDSAAARTNLGLATVAHSGAYTDLSGRPTLATVASSGQYADLLGLPTIPEDYVLPKASNTVLGGVKIGTNISQDVDGTINVAAPYTLPAATASVLGGVIVGNGLNIDGTSHVLTVNTSLFDPAGAATTAVAGVLRAANNLSDLGSITTAKANLGLSTVASSGSYNDLLNKPVIPAAYVLPTASNSVLGGVKIGANLDVAVDGTISGPTPYALPAASGSTLGGIIIGTGLAIDAATHVASVNSSLFDPAGAATAAVAGTLKATNNLSDVGSLATTQANLGLKAVALSNSYNDLDNKPVIPPAYTLPAATAQTLGGIKVGQNLSVAVDGTLSAQNSYVLPTATNSVLGGVIAGSGLNVTSGGILSVDASLFDPAGAATAAAAGTLKASNNLSDLGSVSSAKTNLGLSTVASTGSYNDLQNKPVIPTQYVLPAATATTLGGVKCGANLTCAPDGTMDAQNSYVLPAATNSTLGGIVVGSGLLMNGTSHALSVDGSLYDPAGAATAANANALQKSANLSDLGSAATARTNLGLATVAATGAYADLTGKPVFGTAATHDITDFLLANTLGAHNGAAQLDGNGLLLTSELPPIGISNLTGVGDILTHNANEFVPVTAVGNTVAPLDSNKKVPAANMPAIDYTSLTNLPTFARVATTGAYADLTGTPIGLPPIGAAGGDLTGSYPAPRVAAINGQNMAALGAGILALDASGVPKLATTNQIQGLLGYVPLDAAKNLQDLTNVPNARVNLGLGSMATKDANAFVPDSGADGLMFRTSSTQSGQAVIATRAATATDITNTLGFVPLNSASLGTANGIATLDGNGHLTASQLGSVPFTAITGMPSYIPTSDIGVTVAPLINGLVPAGMIPAPPFATTSTAGTVIVGNDLLIANGVLSVDATKFDASGAATAAAAGSLQKTANLSDLQNPAAARANLGLATVASTGAYADLTGKPALSAVATSGNYADLVNKPIIPSKVSDLTNDLNFLTAATLPVATASSVGVVEPGPYLSVNGSGVLSVNVGNTTNTVAVGNDPRIVHALQDSLLGANGGLAQLDTNGKLQLSEVPQNIPLGYVVGWGTAAQKDVGYFLAQTSLGSALGPAQLDVNGKVQLNEIPQDIPYSYITGGPTQYVLPAATTGTLGGVIIGTGLNVNLGGQVSVQFGNGPNQALNGSLLGQPNGIATLDGNGRIPTTELGGGTAGGVAILDNNGKIPINNLYTNTPNGIPLLDNSGHLLSSQLQTNTPGGIAGLDINGKILLSEIPSHIPASDIGTGTVNDVSFGYLSNVNADIQQQLNSLNDQLVQILNPTGSKPNPNLTAFTNALSSAGSRVVNVVIFGDSETRCYQANCSLGPNNQSSLWANQLKSYLQGKYGNHGSGIIPVTDGIMHLDDGEWSVTGQSCDQVGLVANCWAIPTGGFIGPYQTGIQATGGVLGLTGTASASLSPQTGDAVTIYYAVGSDTGAGFDVTVDGVSRGTYGATTGGSTYGAAKATVNIGGGQHSLRITANGTGCCVYIYGAEWTSGSTGVSVHNLALGGIRSDGWGLNPSQEMAFSDQISGGHTLSIIALGTNEYVTGESASDYATHMSAIINHERGLGASDIMLINEPYVGAGQGGSASQDQIFATANGLSNVNDVLSMSSVQNFGSFGAENGAGYMTGDQVHLSDSGQQAFGAAVIAHIFGSGSSSGGTVGSGGGTFTGGATNSLAVTETVAPGIIITGSSAGGNNADLNLKSADGASYWSISAINGGDSFQFYDHVNNTVVMEMSQNNGVRVRELPGAAAFTVLGTTNVNGGTADFSIKSADGLAWLTMTAFNGGGIDFYNHTNGRTSFSLNDNGVRLNDNATGSTSANLGSNSPAGGASPYTWIKVEVGDGSICWIPAFK